MKLKGERVYFSSQSKVSGPSWQERQGSRSLMWLLHCIPNQETEKMKLWCSSAFLLSFQEATREALPTVKWVFPYQ